MKGLFDTHLFLWWNGEPQNLSSTARAFCDDVDNELLLSVVSLWEIQIKVQIGKLRLTRPLRDIVGDQIKSNRVLLISVTAEHVFALDDLPLTHRDPFDRLLIAQSNFEKASLIRADPLIHQYPVNTIW